MKYTCKVCGIGFNKCSSPKNYTSWCSEGCHQKYWRKNNPEKRRAIAKKAKYGSLLFKLKQTGKCKICAFDRYVELCHIIWRKDGGKLNVNNIVILCPNHHRLFDSNKLSKEEAALIEPLSKLK